VNIDGAHHDPRTVVIVAILDDETPCRGRHPKRRATPIQRTVGATGKAYNWTVATLKADIAAWHASGIETAKPSPRVLRKRWNTVKNEVCVNADTGTVWWSECSKEAYADGIGGAVNAYWNWQISRSGKRGGKRVGFPRSKKKGHDQERVSFTTGPMLADAALGTPRAATCPTRQAGTGRHWWSLTAGSRHRKPVTPASMCRTSAGTKSGNAIVAQLRPTCDDNAAVNLARYEETLASSAQSRPPSSVEPTVRPDLVRQVAVKSRDH
jgi:putative transposase